MVSLPLRASFLRAVYSEQRGRLHISCSCNINKENVTSRRVHQPQHILDSDTALCVCVCGSASVKVYPDWIKSEWQFDNCCLLMVELKSSPPSWTGPLLHTISNHPRLSVNIWILDYSLQFKPLFKHHTRLQWCRDIDTKSIFSKQKHK